ncbi:MAG: hypothetical protein ACLFSM_03710 [Thermoplasmata archaeon]
MRKRRSPGYILGKDGYAHALLYLYNNSTVVSSDLEDLGMGYKKYNELIDSMVSDGLLVVEEQTSPYYQRNLELTDKGEKVAELIIEAEKKARKDVDEDLKDLPA